MIFKAILSNRAQPEYGQTTIPFPIPDSEYDRTIGLLEAMEIGSPTGQDCRVDGLESPCPILNRLTTQSVNVDELDYLAKRLDSFCPSEAAQFQAMASKLCLSNIKDFINLTFCCQQATSSEQASYPSLLPPAKAHSFHCSSSPNRTRFAGLRFGFRLRQNEAKPTGVGVVTPYGVVLDNSMELEQLYDGRHFPEYLYENSLLVLELSSRTEPYEDARPSWLYFPMPDSQIQRTMLRAGISNLEDIRLALVESQIPQNISGIIDLKRDDLNSLNELCRTLAPLDPGNVNKLEAVVLMVQPTCASEICQLAKNLDQFDFVPKPDSPEAGSALTELGYVAYRGSLPLEALMTDDPAEQRQEMGGMA